MPDWLIQVLGMVFGAASVYTAIRVDLAALRVKADMAVASAQRAHERIDQHLEKVKA